MQIDRRFDRLRRKSAGGVFCAYNGTAIGNTDMGDFDDIGLMANYGMERSIGTFDHMPSSAVH